MLGGEFLGLLDLGLKPCREMVNRVNEGVNFHLGTLVVLVGPGIVTAPHTPVRREGLSREGITPGLVSGLMGLPLPLPLGLASRTVP